MKKGKSTETATFNQVPHLNEEALKPHLSIGYHKNARTDQFDLKRASLKIKKEFFTFMDCLKQIEVSGTSMPRVSGTSSSTRTLSSQSTTDINDWQPFGTGRSVGQNGGDRSRKWQHLGDKRYRDNVDNVKSSNDQTLINQGQQSWGYKPNHGTPAPTSVRGGWSYQDPPHAVPQLSNKTVDGRSSFTGRFLKMKDSGPSKKTQAVKVSTVVQSDVEMIVPVEPCQQYSFQLKFVSPTGSVVGIVGNLVLPQLPDIPDYVPPPATQAVDVKFLMGGKYDVVAKNGGPVPQTCLIDYFEALDAFANRVENIANEQKTVNAVKKSRQNNVQDNVEKTQSETLKMYGCVCTSPRLQVTVEPTSKESIFAGVYLYQGMDKNGRPFYKQDNEDRSLLTMSNQGLIRRKRFIGRVDGGGQSSSTTPRNWMLPAQPSRNTGSTQHPPWRQYFGITTQSPDTQYSNRFSDPGQSSGSVTLDNKGSTLRCPEENLNLNLRRNAEVVNSISSWEQCSKRCSEKASCQYWVWDTRKVGPGAGSCALMEGFGSKVFDSNAVTGRWDCKYKGRVNLKRGQF